MSMPKGFKSRKGYATVSQIEGGMDYRAIAEKMTCDGDKMNHATARNVFLRAMTKLARPLHELYRMNTDAASIVRTTKDPEFQSGILDIIEEIQGGTRIT